MYGRFLYRSAFSFRADLDEPEPADYERFAVARTPLADCSTHFVSTHAYGDMPAILDDLRLIDTGLTIAHLLELFHTRHPASLKVCALLHKPARARVVIAVDYLGFTIEDKFVVGYGLDFAERYRNLPYIGVVERS